MPVVSSRSWLCCTVAPVASHWPDIMKRQQRQKFYKFEEKKKTGCFVNIVSALLTLNWCGCCYHLWLLNIAPSPPCWHWVLLPYVFSWPLSNPTPSLVYHHLLWTENRRSVRAEVTSMLFPGYLFTATATEFCHITRPPTVFPFLQHLNCQTTDAVLNSFCPLYIWAIRGDECLG